MAQSVERLTLDLSSGLGLRVVGSGFTLDSVLRMKSTLNERLYEE